MSISRRILLASAAALTAFSWSAVAARAGGLDAVLPFVAPTALLAIAVSWLAFAFAGKRLPTLSTLWSALVGGLALSPMFAFTYARNHDLGATIVVLLAVAGGAAISGALWQLRERAIAAFSEWRKNKAVQAPAPQPSLRSSRTSRTVARLMRIER